MVDSEKVHKILVVDDEPLLRESIGGFFSKRGFDVMLTEDGRAAANLLSRQKVDLIISDYRMPNKDGAFLLDHVQAMKGERPPFVFITGYSDISREEAMKRGAAAFFDKPVDRRELLACVRKLLGMEEEG